MGVNSDYKLASIVYFETEGRSNLVQVIRTVKRTIKKRPEIPRKLVIFTALGEGPARAYNELQEYDPEIIAVTFPPSFAVKLDNETIHPSIHPKLMAFFNGVNIRVITGRLPFDPIEGAQNHQTKLMRDVLSLFGGSFALCVQAVLQACDHGAINIGERVISITGDCAAVVTVSTTEKFLSPECGLAINEILCKPRNLTIARRKPEPRTSPALDVSPTIPTAPKALLP